MLSTMQDEPLSLGRLLAHAETAHRSSTVATWTGDRLRVRTYGEVAARARRLARALARLGVAPGDRVATFMWNNSEHLEAYAAVPAMGAVLHPLNIRLSEQQLVHVANHAEDSVVIVDGDLLERFAVVARELRTVRHVLVVGADPAEVVAPPGAAAHGYEDLLAAEEATYDFPVLDERTAATICFTSGTTGDPKGVAYSHRSLVLHAMYVTTPGAVGLCADDRCLAIVPMFHVNAWSLPYAALLSGASLVMPDRFLQAQPLLALMAQARPTVAAAVPTIWSGILTRLETHPQDISHLRTAVVGGSAVAPAVMRTFEERHGVSIIHAWGMTETSAIGTVARPPAQTNDPWTARATQGQFSPLVEHRLVSEDGTLVPHDGLGQGELQVRGPWITGSYLGTGDDSAFADGWLRTGDIGRISPDGYLTLVDRAKDVIKSGGEWISSVDMENDVMSHPDVVEAAVFGVPDPTWDERPCVAVVLRPGALATTTDLRHHLARSWARWQLPDAWMVVPDVPKTSVGKFDKVALRRLHAENGEADLGCEAALPRDD